MPEVARLEPVDLRAVWPNEAGDFTPWLAENLEELSKALGIDLELIQREAPVGSFSLDIHARDVNQNRTVVVENQLEPTAWTQWQPTKLGPLLPAWRQETCPT